MFLQNDNQVATACYMHERENKELKRSGSGKRQTLKFCANAFCRLLSKLKRFAYTANKMFAFVDL